MDWEKRAKGLHLTALAMRDAAICARAEREGTEEVKMAYAIEAVACVVSGLVLGTLIAGITLFLWVC